MKKTSMVFLVIILTVIGVQSCKKDKAEPKDEEADKQLYNEIKQSGYSFYRDSATLSGVSPSPHGSFKLRFNSIAQAALDSTGELPAGGAFPTGSIIVKEIYSGSSLQLSAVMKKESTANSGSGWLWAEYKPDGAVAFSVAKKGDGCVSCHSGTPNRDLTRTFDLH